MHSLNKGNLAVSHVRARQHAHMPKQMPERSSRSMGRKRKKNKIYCQGGGTFFSSIVCSQVSLSELPPPAVASPAVKIPLKISVKLYCIPEYRDFSTAEIGSHRLMNIFLIFFSLVPKINRHGLMLCHVMSIRF